MLGTYRCGISFKECLIRNNVQMAEDYLRHTRLSAIQSNGHVFALSHRQLAGESSLLAEGEGAGCLY